jgi:hypothetical protein
VTDKLKIRFSDPRPIPVWGKEGEFYQNIDVNRDVDDTHMGHITSAKTVDWTRCVLRHRSRVRPR